MVTGGTGTLGRPLVKELLSGKYGNPAKVTVFSRDEFKQHDMRLQWLRKRTATDEVAYGSAGQLDFTIGYVQHKDEIIEELRKTDVVIHAAAMKQVPACQYKPKQAISTNIMGFQNIVDAIAELGLPIETVLIISTDKAVAPYNTYGKTKALQEDIMVAANLNSSTRFIGVRYGNVLSSRGSVIPLFHDQITSGGPVTITDPRMTRFFLPLHTCLETIMDAYREARPGELYVPILKSALITDLAKVMIAHLARDKVIESVITGIRPGEKVHELLISEEEASHTVLRGNYYVVQPLLPELTRASRELPMLDSYCSKDCVMTVGELAKFLHEEGIV